MYQILILCTANVCRSPATQAFLSRDLQGRQVRVDSAGTLAVDGNRVDGMIQSLMTERGFPEVSQHRSRSLMPSHLGRYDLILCMERSHMNQIQKISPLTVGKSMLVGHWDGAKEVDDPIGRSQQTYSSALDIMQKFSAQWAKKIIAMGIIV